MDVRIKLPVNPKNLTDQANVYSRMIKFCEGFKKCIGVSIWGFSDKYSWIPPIFKGEGAALLWDDNFVKKPAYSAVEAALH